MAGNRVNNVPNVFISINDKTFDTKNHLLSLTVERCIGDVANNYTLEVFDETAEDVEMLLMSGYPPEITIRYSNSPNGTFEEFTGSVFDYTTSWVGLHTMLSITGVLGSGGGMLGRIGNQTITWVENATYPTQEQLDAAGITGFYHDQVTGQDTNDSEGTIETTDEEGNTIVKNYSNYPYLIINDPIMEGYNESKTPTYKTNQRIRPSDLFKRIINKLNSSYDPNIKLDESHVVETALIYQNDWSQMNESILDYFQNVLCPASISTDGKSGYKVVDSETGFRFEPVDYNRKSQSSLTLEYGKRNSEVISISINVSGAVAMAGGAYDANGNYTVVTGALDDIFGDQISYQNLEGYVVNKFSELDSTGKYTPNAGDSNKQPNTNLWSDIGNGESYSPTFWVNSSASKDKLMVSASDKWENIRESVYSGEIKVWGRTGSFYSPGSFIQLNVQGKKGQHYLTGQYYITKITDYISSQGFVKTLKVVKNTASRLAAGVEVGSKFDLDNIQDMGDLSPYNTEGKDIDSALLSLVLSHVITADEAVKMTQQNRESKLVTDKESIFKILTSKNNEDEKAFILDEAHPYVNVLTSGNSAEDRNFLFGGK